MTNQLLQSHIVDKTNPNICLVCNANMNKIHCMEQAKSISVDDPIFFYKCKNCDCYYAPESAKLANELYKKRESNNYAPNKSSWMKYVQKYQIRYHYLNLIRKYNADFVIDYGCGNGVLSNSLLVSNVIVYSVDVQVNRPHGLNENISYYSSDSINLPERTGRTIFILRHVLEHFENPIPELKKIAALANVGDIFIIETPTADSLFKKIMKSGWPGYFPPYHVMVPTLTTLRFIADSAGLAFIRSSRREPPIFGSYFARNSLVTTNIHRIAGIIFYPLQFIASKLSGMSEAIEVIVEKP
jgi:2-polyprenyl-3-methyl-5-hydroxy-6-metoxy-1,4-benzoquinol methylase